MTPPRMKVRRLSARGQPPRYMTAGAAGMDLTAAPEQVVRLEPGGGKALIPTGIAVELPPGHEGQVRPRSGLAVRHGVTVLNAPGTVDEDYRGELRVALINLGPEPVTIEPGMRIAQLVVAPVTRVQVQLVDALEQTDRGDGGFGHTG